VRSAVIGNAGTLVVFRVGSRDSELLALEFRTMERGALADQEPFTAWLRRGNGQERIFVAPMQYAQLGTAEVIRYESRTHAYDFLLSTQASNVLNDPARKRFCNFRILIAGRPGQGSSSGTRAACLAKESLPAVIAVRLRDALLESYARRQYYPDKLSFLFST
jgi:hypothetical protein